MLKKPLIHCLFYIVGIALLVIARKAEPTNIAGPGLDIPVFVFLFFAILFMVLKGLTDPAITKRNEKLIAVIHVTGFLLIIAWACFA